MSCQVVSITSTPVSNLYSASHKGRGKFRNYNIESFNKEESFHGATTALVQAIHGLLGNVQIKLYPSTYSNRII